jgi:hypothetical protein
MAADFGRMTDNLFRNRIKEELPTIRELSRERLETICADHRNIGLGTLIPDSTGNLLFLRNTSIYFDRNAQGLCSALGLTRM